MRIAVLALIATSLAACASDVTSPQLQPAPENSVATAGDAMGHGPWAFGRRGMGFGPMMFASRHLPDNLKLTDAQRTQVRSLMSAFRTAHKDDLSAMAAVGRQAFAARRSGVKLTADQRKAMFAQTAPVRQRLMAANKDLRAQIEQVLTPDQRSWLASHRPVRQARHRAA
jgi:Spy/CpxP family protein refolding chaperone